MASCRTSAGIQILASAVCLDIKGFAGDSIRQCICEVFDTFVGPKRLTLAFAPFPQAIAKYRGVVRLNGRAPASTNEREPMK